MFNFNTVTNPDAGLLQGSSEWQLGGDIYDFIVENLNIIVVKFSLWQLTAIRIVSLFLAGQLTAQKASN